MRQSFSGFKIYQFKFWIFQGFVVQNHGTYCANFNDIFIYQICKRRVQQEVRLGIMLKIWANFRKSEHGHAYKHYFYIKTDVFTNDPFLRSCSNNNLLDILLHGSEEFCVRVSKEISKSTIKFLKVSKRLSWSLYWPLTIYKYVSRKILFLCDTTITTIFVLFSSKFTELTKSGLWLLVSVVSCPVLLYLFFIELFFMYSFIYCLEMVDVLLALLFQVHYFFM